MANDIQWPAWQDVEWRGVDRNEARRLICVDVEPTNGQTLPTGYAPHGVQFMLVYQSDIAKVQRLVQNEEQKTLLAMAQRKFDEEFAKHLKQCGGDAEKARATIGCSVEMFYEDLPGGKGGRGPLRSLTVHPDEVPAPHTPTAAAAQQAEALTNAILKAVEMGRQQGQPPQRTDNNQKR